MATRLTPLGAVARGAAAGMVGTAAMDLVWFARYKRSGGDDGLLDWEFATFEGWEEAPAPAQVGRRLFEGLFQRELPPEAAATVNTVAHWGTGIAWGALFGLAAGSTSAPKVRHGLVLGPAAWLTSYVVLPLAKLYKPIWEYDPATLGRDLSAHAVFGTATAATYRALAPRG